MTVKWTTRTIGYGRWSDRRNADQCESNEAQREFIEEFCKENGWEMVEYFCDERKSGRRKQNATNRDELDRPGLWAAVDAIKPGYTLVAWRPDRIARDVFLDELVRRQVEKAGGRVVTVLANVEGDTPEANMMRTILAACSQ